MRKLLGEDGDLIKTIPGRGYLFACEAGEAGSGVGESNPLAPASSASDLDNPAVSLPHDPVSGNEPVAVVIDNDPNVREAICGLLRSVGLRAECFATVREFTDSVPPSPPCCLILDVWLPGQNGLDFQAQLARANVHIPVIFVSGHADVHAAVRAMKAGAFEFLTKPLRHEELLNAVKATIALSIDQRDQLGGRRTAACLRALQRG
jgi:FixJ family two-component response regulator